jgi:hypothetical protein
MARQLVVQPQADCDITAAAVWYEDQRSGLGARFLNELSQVLQRIQQNPLEFPRLDDDSSCPSQALSLGVYFLADLSVVKVLAVLHLHRHPDMWKSLN